MSYAVSPAGLALIQHYEGFTAEPMQLSESTWVVGFGHIRVGEPGVPVNENEASGLLALDLAPVERMVNARLQRQLTQSQYDALVSFAVSVGAEAFAQSQVLRRVNAGDFVAAACAMDAWRKGEVEGELQVVDALVRRRADEKAMFLKDLPPKAAPSTTLRAKLDYAAAVLGAPTTPAVAVSPVPYVAPVADVAAPAETPVVVEEPVVEAPSIEAPQTAAQRITEILKSEPATEALLLTQVVSDEDVAADEDEITTANAKPNARKIEPITPRADLRIVHGGPRKSRFPKFRVSTSDSIETIGLIALMLFGVGLTLIGGSMLLTSEGQTLELAAAAAFATPGLLAMMLAGYGFLRGMRKAHA